jgi:hypothetical protein
MSPALAAAGISPHANVAPRLQGIRAQLERNMTSNRLAHLLEQRADAADLAKAGVLQRLDVAPTLQGVQRTLERNIAKANLFHALSSRPSLQRLAERGIYREVQSPSGRGYSQQQQQQAEQAYYEEQARQQYYAQQEQQQQQQQQQYYSQSQQSSYAQQPGVSRSRAFQLTRLLLKFVASLSESGEISLQTKASIKDLIVDQNGPSHVTIAFTSARCCMRRRDWQARPQAHR